MLSTPTEAGSRAGSKRSLCQVQKVLVRHQGWGDSLGLGQLMERIIQRTERLGHQQALQHGHAAHPPPRRAEVSPCSPFGCCSTSEGALSQGSSLAGGRKSSSAYSRSLLTTGFTQVSPHAMHVRAASTAIPQRTPCFKAHPPHFL